VGTGLRPGFHRTDVRASLARSYAAVVVVLVATPHRCGEAVCSDVRRVEHTGAYSGRGDERPHLTACLPRGSRLIFSETISEKRAKAERGCVGCGACAGGLQLLRSA